MNKRNIPSWAAQAANAAALTGAMLWGRPPRLAAIRDGAAAGRWQHDDWNALLRRFVVNGEVDYVNFKRVRRLLEIYLDRIADARPDDWIDADDQLAFYINAYNAIVIHEIIMYDPAASFLDIPAAFARPYPVGHRNVSLHELEHSIIRAFGDPFVHMALVCGARGCPPLQSFAYTGPQLRNQLAAVTAEFLQDQQRGLRYDGVLHILYLSPIFRWYAGDWIDPSSMPSVASTLRGLLQPRLGLPRLAPYMPVPVQKALTTAGTPPRLEFIPYDWSLNAVSMEIGHKPRMV